MPRWFLFCIITGDETFIKALGVMKKYELAFNYLKHNVPTWLLHYRHLQKRLKNTKEKIHLLLHAIIPWSLFPVRWFELPPKILTVLQEIHSFHSLFFQLSWSFFTFLVVTYLIGLQSFHVLKQNTSTHEDSMQKGKLRQEKK